MKKTLDRNKLVALRKERKWDQKKAAKAAGVSLPTYMNAESGNPIHQGTAMAIAVAYRKPVRDLEAQEEAVA